MKKYNISNFYSTYKNSSIYKNIPDIIEATTPLRNFGLTYFAMVKYDANNIMQSFTSCERVIEIFSKNPGIFYEDLFSSPARLLRAGEYYATGPFGVCSHMISENFKGFSSIKDYKNGDREIFHFAIDNANFNTNHYDLLRLFILEFKDKASQLIEKADKIFVPIVSPKTNPMAMLDHLILLNSNVNSFLTQDEYNYCKCLQVATIHCLSHREAQCLSMLLQGNLTKQIASSLNLSQRTAEAYINNIKSKLGCRNKIDAVRKTLNFDFKNSLIETMHIAIDSQNTREINSQTSVVRSDYNRSKCLYTSKKYNLSTRETQCLKLLLEGALNKQIAYLLNLSQKTIEIYIDNLKNKLNCRTKTDVIIKTLSE